MNEHSARFVKILIFKINLDNIIEMDTLRTQRARFLAEYFKKLRSTVNVQERIELFLEILDVFSDLNEDSQKIFQV